jgi:hypothetical protein
VIDTRPDLADDLYVNSDNSDSKGDTMINVCVTPGDELVIDGHIVPWATVRAARRRLLLHEDFGAEYELPCGFLMPATYIVEAADQLHAQEREANRWP